MGLEMRPRDTAGIGLLVLKAGRWNGRQVVPADRVRVSTTPHARESEFFDYGYQWRLRTGRAGIGGVTTGGRMPMT